MVEEIQTDLYRIEIPLPRNPLKTLNSYIIKGDERFLIVDTGLNRQECKSAMFSGLKELNVDLNRTDIFMTHMHTDHIGMVESLTTKTSTVYFSKFESIILPPPGPRAEKRLGEFVMFYLSHGFPEGELQKAAEGHPGFRYNPRLPSDIHGLGDGDLITMGNYSFRCIETPGHSPGHLCLYDEKEKIFISGDHILFDITPNITRWPELENSLKSYLESLDRVYPLEMRLVLPGHRSLMNDHRKRIRELREHHDNRLHQILSVLDGKGKTAWEISPHISWDIRSDSWEGFPPMQKWFAMGETIAHLYYLEAEGRIQRKKEDTINRYSLA